MKFHFAASSEPLKEGSTIQAACGKEIPKAAFKVMADLDWRPYVGYGVNCATCNKTELPKRGFLYVVCTGQESLTEVQNRGE